MELGPLENIKSDSQAEKSSEEGQEYISPTYTPSYAPPVLSDEDSESESEKEEDLDLRQVNWIRRTKLRTDGIRTHVYYYEDSKNIRLRSLNDVQKYCTENNIKFEPELFNFKGDYKYNGLVKSPGSESPSFASAANTQA